MTSPDEPTFLDRDRIRDADAGTAWLREILVFRETSSTNDVLHRLAQDGAPEGTVVFAEAQSAGRGQFGRTWDSRPGLGLWFSILLRPDWRTEDFPQLTPLVAVAIAETLQKAIAPHVTIKHPNDIHVQGRKLAGILTEARPGASAYAVVGIGLNTGHQPSDFPPSLSDRATSIAMLTGQSPDRDLLAGHLLAGLGALYQRSTPPGASVLERYESLSSRAECATLPA